MALSLTPEDLQAIGDVFDARAKVAVNQLVPPMMEAVIKKLVPPMIEAAIEDLKLMIAASFNEVFERLDRLEVKVDRIERIQKAEIERLDAHETQLKNFRKALHAA